MITSMPRQTKEDSMWTSDRRLYLDDEGKVVGADDPGRTTLLVGEGGKLPADRARELGLISDEDPAPSKPDDDKRKQPTNDKRKQPTEDK